MRSTPRAFRKLAIQAAQDSRSALRSLAVVAIFVLARVSLTLRASPSGLSTQDDRLEFAVQILAGRGARHLLVAHERKRAWTLVAGHARPAPFVQAGLILQRAFTQDDDRVDPLAPFVVRQSDHGYVMNGRVAADHRLDIGWIDVLAPGDDHVAFAIDEMDVAVGVATRHVADRAIFAAERLAGFLRQLPIAVENIRVARVKLADVAIRRFVAI